jgi:hypothetical protein
MREPAGGKGAEDRDAEHAAGLSCAVQSARCHTGPSGLNRAEQAHHLAGGLGRGLLDLDWVRRNPNSRAIDITDAGRTGIAETFAIDLS